MFHKVVNATVRMALKHIRLKNKTLKIFANFIGKHLRLRSYKQICWTKYIYHSSHSSDIVSQMFLALLNIFGKFLNNFHFRIRISYREYFKIFRRATFYLWITAFGMQWYIMPISFKHGSHLVLVNSNERYWASARISLQMWTQR